jgi:hypothetical protein
VNLVVLGQPDKKASAARRELPQGREEGKREEAEEEEDGG